MSQRQLLNSNQGKTSRIASKLGAAEPEFENFSANAAAFRQQMQQQAGVASSTAKPNPAPKTESKKKPTEKVAEKKQEIQEQADAQRQQREANAAMRVITQQEQRAARQAEREAAKQARVAALEAKEAQRKEGIRIAGIVKGIVTIGWQTLALNAKASKENAESKIQATLEAGKLPNDTQQAYLQDFKVAVDQLKTFVDNASKDQLPKKIDANLLPAELKSSQAGQKQSIREQCQEILTVYELAYSAFEQSIQEIEKLQKQVGQLDQTSAQLDQHKGRFAKQTAKPATSSTWCCCFGNKDSKPQAQAQTPAQESMDNDAHTALLSPRSNNRS